MEGVEGRGVNMWRRYDKRQEIKCKGKRLEIETAL